MKRYLLFAVFMMQICLSYAQVKYRGGASVLFMNKVLTNSYFMFGMNGYVELSKPEKRLKFANRYSLCYLASPKVETSAIAFGPSGQSIKVKGITSTSIFSLGVDFKFYFGSHEDYSRGAFYFSIGLAAHLTKVLQKYEHFNYAFYTIEKVSNPTSENTYNYFGGMWKVGPGYEREIGGMILFAEPTCMIGDLEARRLPYRFNQHLFVGLTIGMRPSLTKD